MLQQRCLLSASISFECNCATSRESSARVKLGSSVMDVIVSVFITFSCVEKKGKTLLDSIMQTIEQASLLPAYQLRSSCIFHTHGQVNFYLIRSSDHRSTIG